MEKKRCNNFTIVEIEMLVDLVETHKAVVECKKTDTVTSSAKEAEWQKIEIAFNTVCGTGRSAKMLRGKWDSLKKTTKKDYANYKQCLYKTGGGPAASTSQLSAIGNRVLKIIGEQVTGKAAKGSDLADDQLPNWPNSDVVLTAVPADAIVVENVDIVNQAGCSWESWNPEQLRQPMSKALQNTDAQSISLAPEGEPDHTVSMTPNTFEAQTPKLVTKSTNRKRFYKNESTSAKLQKQRSGMVYEELAKKKIELVELQIAILKEEAELKAVRLAEKHALEMKILEIDLRNKENNSYFVIIFYTLQ